MQSYDPWDSYWPVRSNRGKTQERVYSSLIELVSLLRPEEDGLGRLVVDLNPNTTAELLAWCSRFGLLGTLHSDVRHFSLTPRLLNGTLVQVRFVATSRGWQWHAHRTTVDGEEMVFLDPVQGRRREPHLFLINTLLEGSGRSVRSLEALALAPEEMWPNNWPQPGALLETETNLLEVSRLADLAARYLPTLPAAERLSHWYLRLLPKLSLDSIASPLAFRPCGTATRPCG